MKPWTNQGKFGVSGGAEVYSPFFSIFFPSFFASKTST